MFALVDLSGTGGREGLGCLRKLRQLEGAGGIGGKEVVGACIGALLRGASVENCAPHVVVTLKAALLDEAVALLEVQGRQARGLKGLV